MIEFIIDFSDEQLSDEEEKAFKNAAKTALLHEGIDFDCEISAVITNNEGIREINRDYRNIDSPTDVLSFPQYEFESPGSFSKKITESPVLLGDIVISKEKMISQAEELGHSFLDELSYLTVHSCLHLLGYDHMIDEDKKIMRDKEKEICEVINNGKVF